MVYHHFQLVGAPSLILTNSAFWPFPTPQNFARGYPPMYMQVDYRPLLGWSCLRGNLLIPTLQWPLQNRFHFIYLPSCHFTTHTTHYSVGLKPLFVYCWCRPFIEHLEGCRKVFLSSTCSLDWSLLCMALKERKPSVSWKTESHRGLLPEKLWPCYQVLGAHVIVAWQVCSIAKIFLLFLLIGTQKEFWKFENLHPYDLRGFEVWFQGAYNTRGFRLD